MTDPILFQVPAQFKAQLDSGFLIRTGALLKETGSGQIVAHLQETGLAQNLISTAVGSPFAPISAVSSVVGNFQIAQLKRMIEGLQILQYANLGATVAGIGVSAIGFAVMNKKLNHLQATLDTLVSHIDSRFKEIHIRDIRGHYSKVHGLFNQADQAHFLTSSSEEWRKIAGDLADESAYFRGELAYLLQHETFDRELFEQMTQSYALCNAGRIECLVMSRELAAAHKVAQDVAGDYNSLFDPLNPTRLARKSIAFREIHGEPSDHMPQPELEGIKALVNNLREAQDAALSKPYLIQTLIDKEIDGYQYIKQLHEEKDRPLLLLSAT